MPQIKKCLGILENRWGHEGQGGYKEGLDVAGRCDTVERIEPEAGGPASTHYLSDTESENGHANVNTNSDGRLCDAKTAIAGEVTDSEEGRQHLHKLVQFIEGTILQDWEKAKTTTNRKVRFLDLWMYFSPGELLYIPPKLEESRNSGTNQNKFYHTVWRCCSITLDPLQDDYPDDWRPNETRELALLAYYMDYNGHSYGQAHIWHSIKYYAGEKDITALTIYPMRFAKNSEQKITDLHNQGKLFQKRIMDRHLHYDGWTLTDQVFGSPNLESEHINGAVIRDSRYGCQSKVSETLKKSKVTHVDDCDIVLLPRRAIAYALKERKFIMVDIHSLRSIAPQQNIFEDLKIDEHQNIVTSLVKSHFRKQKLQKEQSRVSLNQDLIQGKGSGLFILLHGVPGVGKTATAEAVAQANKKPLLVITCGDLGFYPRDVEVTLSNIFRLANIWDCVLLLDEADVFLTRREQHDLKRNALVSVFLRVLEYYSGILFLTTNHVGVLDEAFKSRIHISLYYLPLSREYTLAIYEVNIRKLHAMEKEKHELQTKADCKVIKQLLLIIDESSIIDYASWQYTDRENQPHQRWNGRQIRNAFQIAYSLADFDMHRAPSRKNEKSYVNNTKDNEKQTAFTLDYRQFKIVDEAILRFDHYLLAAKQGNTDEDLARKAGTRADDSRSGICTPIT